MSLADSAERLVYRVGGLPVALDALLQGPPRSTEPGLRTAFAHHYWHPENAGEWAELGAAMLLWPIGLLLSAAWFTFRNGPVIRQRHGTSLPAQLRGQLRLYFKDGVLPPWYYIFSLHDDGERRAATFIQRFETKTCFFRLLKARKGTPLNDKARFAEYCAERQIRCVPIFMQLNGTDPGRELPDEDLFVKPRCGRGGSGAERWDRIAERTFIGPSGAKRSSDALLEQLVERSRHRPLIVQPRLQPHRELVPITSGALPTVRVLTCINEIGEAEVIAAVLRMSFGENRTVDNLHAGGIGALIDVASGTLGKASNLGSDARLGWLAAHPDSGARIEGKSVPWWEETKARAIAAHRHFSDRVVVGWDIAILEDGPIFIEGNGNPDLDILQRFMRTGLRKHRLGILLAYHLREHGLHAAV